MMWQRERVSFEIGQLVRHYRLDRNGSHTGRVVGKDSSRGKTVYEVESRPRSTGKFYSESELEAVPDDVSGPA